LVTESTTMLTEEDIRQRVTAVRRRISAAATRVGRDPSEITLVAVTKTHSPATVEQAYAAGLRIFGENRIEEASPKAAEVARLIAPAATPIWHMIGHVQSRKAQDVVPWASVVHSVDSLKLAERLGRFVMDLGSVEEKKPGALAVLLEVNISGEASKYGLTPGELPSILNAVSVLQGIRLQGLMTMAPVVDNPELARPVFSGLRLLRDQIVKSHPGINLRELSMGMSDDFEVAVEEGATIVRIGRAIFG
jgi:PLP dependent protein